MNIERTQAPTSRTMALTRDLSRMPSQCVGCKDCRGFCQALIDALVLPRIILAKGPGS